MMDINSIYHILITYIVYNTTMMQKVALMQVILEEFL